MRLVAADLLARGVALELREAGHKVVLRWTDAMKECKLGARVRVQVVSRIHPGWLADRVRQVREAALSDGCLRHGCFNRRAWW